ncbi:hypothetical protein AN161_23925 [Lysinibacillus sp. FJAT-14222]|nr:hypothetical protein AN161_23925 [Lysinibacillus sp. FJAT-14222]
MSQVFYAKQVQEVPTFLFTGFSFFMTAIYFSFFVRKHKQANLWKGNINYVVKLNIASMLAFMGFYFAFTSFSGCLPAERSESLRRMSRNRKGVLCASTKPIPDAIMP